MISFLLKMPVVFWKKLILIMLPNFNWVLIKPINSSKKGAYYVMD
jgi:hypothetical protein